MSNCLGKDQAHLAARLSLEELAPLCGLDVDASRVVLLLPLAELLLQHGERLARTTRPEAEPYFIGALGRPGDG